MERWTRTQDVLTRFAKSRAPLYTALARVIAKAEQRLSELRQETAPADLPPIASRDQALAYALALRVYIWIKTRDGDPHILPPAGIKARPVPLSDLAAWLLQGLPRKRLLGESTGRACQASGDASCAFYAAVLGFKLTS